MARLELITNLKLIDGSTRTTVPTPEELPLGYMCFGIVNSRASIWGNYDGSVHDLVEEGTALNLENGEGYGSIRMNKSNCTAKGDFAISSGYYASANGDSTYAGGVSSIADTEGSISYGPSTQTKNGVLAAFGRYNNPTTGDIVEVGNGTGDSRSNAFAVLTDGRAKVQTAPKDNDDVVRKSELDTKLDKAGGTINGSLIIANDLSVQGKTTSVDTQSLKVADKLIYVARDNTTALTSPAGLITPKYDGTNNGGIVYDSTGTAYVGDIALDSNGNVDVNSSDLQPIATRNAIIADGNIVKWNNTNLTLVDTGINVDNVAKKTELDNKVDKVTGKGLSTNDFTNDEKNKLAGIEAKAQVNVIETIEAGNNITVSKSDKKVTISATSGVDVVQTTGQDPEVVMSQKAVTDAILALSTNVVNSINGMSGVVEIDYSDVGAVSANLSIYPTSTADLTIGTREAANIYIDDSGVSKKISLQQVKNMATKILSTSSLQDSKINNLDTDDYVFKKE